MKKLLLILLCLPMIGFGQLTVIPDANFEQTLINLGYDTPPINGSVPTANINTVTHLFVDSLNIADLTGIESFTSLIELDCNTNQLTFLNLSNNIVLEKLNCTVNQLTTLDLSNNVALLDLRAGYNSIPSLDLSNNILLEILAMSTCAITCPSTLNQLNVTANTELISLSLIQHNISNLDLSNCNKIKYLNLTGNPLGSVNVTNLYQLEQLGVSSCSLSTLSVSNNQFLQTLYCAGNQLSSLDLSNNTKLTTLWCNSNQLTFLDLRNNNNMNFTSLYPIDPSVYPAINTTYNLNLTCINVDDANYCNTDWTSSLGFFIDSTHYFSNNCSGATSIQEHSTNKELLKVTDLLGRETKGTKNEVLFYIYDDGTVEKRIVIE